MENKPEMNLLKENINVSDDEIVCTIETCQNGCHKLTPQKDSISKFVDEFNRPLSSNTLLKSSILQKDGKHQVFYHGTNNEDFERFDESLIGTAHDFGWYGRGFYFCYTRDEASFYGPYIREACLAMKNPFYFSEELMEMNGQHTSIVGNMAVFAINLSKKFPNLAAKLSVSTVDYFNIHGEGVGEKRLSLPDFADAVLNIFRDPEFKIYEYWDWDENTHKFCYKMGEDYNAVHQEFLTRKDAAEYRLEMATTYVMQRKYAYVEFHIPEYFMEQISEDFTKELKCRGYDGVLQSKYGDEVVCFDPNQIVFCKKEGL